MVIIILLQHKPTSYATKVVLIEQLFSLAFCATNCTWLFFTVPRVTWVASTVL